MHMISRVHFILITGPRPESEKEKTKQNKKKGKAFKNKENIRGTNGIQWDASTVSDYRQFDENCIMLT